MVPYPREGVCICMKKILIALGVVFGVVLLAAVGLVTYLTVTEYSPADVEALAITLSAQRAGVSVGDRLDVMTFNTGYGALGRDADFFMDGGTGVNPESQAVVEDNITGILSALTLKNADIYLLQEVDRDSARSYHIDQAEFYRHGLSMNMAYAANYRCAFVPFPWPPIGQVDSGLVTFTNLDASGAVRESLPVPFSWPVRVANLKRCLLIERVPVSGTDKELVIVNLHLDAYDDGSGKAAQTEQLMNLLHMEYRAGNYVIAGGDFNQTFEPGGELLSPDYWQPGELDPADLPEGFSYVYDASGPTCRLLNQPYTGDRSRTQLYGIDGFIVSDNLKINHVETIDLNFLNSDHNPVFLQVTLQ